MELHGPPSVPQRHRISVDLDQLHPTTFALSKGQLDNPTDEPTWLAFGTLERDYILITSWEYLADPLHSCATTVFLATSPSDAFVRPI